MIDRVFGPSALFLVEKLKASSKSGTPVNMEASFSQLTLDVIGKVCLFVCVSVCVYVHVRMPMCVSVPLLADMSVMSVKRYIYCFQMHTQAVFNYDFNSLTTDSPIIQAVYTALKETESRATDLLPVWKVGRASNYVTTFAASVTATSFLPCLFVVALFLLALPLGLQKPLAKIFTHPYCFPLPFSKQLPFISAFIPRQRKALEAVELIRNTTNDLIKKCKVGWQACLFEYEYLRILVSKLVVLIV